MTKPFKVAGKKGCTWKGNFCPAYDRDMHPTEAGCAKYKKLLSGCNVRLEQCIKDDPNGIYI